MLFDLLYRVHLLFQLLLVSNPFCLFRITHFLGSPISQYLCSDDAIIFLCLDDGIFVLNRFLFPLLHQTRFGQPLFDAGHSLLFSLLLGSPLPLVQLLRTLGSKGVLFRLLVLRLLLQRAKSGHFHLPFMTEPLLFLHKLLLTPLLFLNVHSNAAVLLDFCLTLPCLEANLFGICQCDILHHEFFPFLFLLCRPPVIRLHLLDVPQHSLLLLMLEFQLSKPFSLPLLHLGFDHSRALAPVLNTLYLPFLVHLQRFESLHFHHRIEPFLLRDALRSNLLLFFDLKIMDRCTLRIQ
mmetsp:Transcript_6858/g.13010  ORF Transcript_6858/g.13010 Transcript_6858/m.13010 type:complete len:294 (+) Transcript_6858:1514-2395(+)